MDFCLLVAHQGIIRDQSIPAERDKRLKGVAPPPTTDIVGLGEDMGHARMLHGLNQEQAGSLNRLGPVFCTRTISRHRVESLHHDGRSPHPVTNGVLQTFRSTHLIHASVRPLGAVLLPVEQKIHRRGPNFDQIN